MLHEIDESLRALVRRDALNGADVEVLFDAPTREWATRRNTPTIDIYLYDIREDLKRREFGQIDVRGENGHITARKAPPRYFKLSYLITAWTQRPEDEHRLLASVLGCFLRHDRLPDAVLSETIKNQRFPVLVHIALPPPEDRSLSDVWSALGGELKPSLDVVVTAPIELGRVEEAAALVLEQPRFSFERPETAEERQGRRRRRGAEGDGEAADEEIQEETIKAGKDIQPGRIFTIRGSSEPRPPKRS